MKGGGNMKRRFAFGLVLMASAVFVLGCSNYGVLSPTKTDAVAIEDLANNWANYTVYWTGIDIGEPTLSNEAAFLRLQCDLTPFASQ
jgi:hypothetical protein